MTLIKKSEIQHWASGGILLTFIVTMIIQVTVSLSFLISSMVKLFQSVQKKLNRVVGSFITKQGLLPVLNVHIKS